MSRNSSQQMWMPLANPTFPLPWLYKRHHVKHQNELRSKKHLSITKCQILPKTNKRLSYLQANEQNQRGRSLGPTTTRNIILGLQFSSSGYTVELPETKGHNLEQQQEARHRFLTDNHDPCV
jgi:hypothetical protein